MSGRLTLGLKVGDTVGTQEGIGVGMTGDGLDGDAEGASDEAGGIWLRRGRSSVVMGAILGYVTGRVETNDGRRQRKGLLLHVGVTRTYGNGDKRSKVGTSGFCLGSGKCMVEWRSGRLIDWAPSSAYWMLDCGGFLC
jgi:hypothetical protein